MLYRIIIVLLLSSIVALNGCVGSKKNDKPKSVKLTLSDDSLKKYFNKNRQEAIVKEIEPVKTFFSTNKFTLYPSNANRKSYKGVFIRFNILENKIRDKTGIPIVMLKDTFFVNTKYKDGYALSSDTIEVIKNIEYIRNELREHLTENDLESIVYVYKSGIFTTRTIHMRNDE